MCESVCVRESESEKGGGRERDRERERGRERVCERERQRERLKGINVCERLRAKKHTFHDYVKPMVLVFTTFCHNRLARIEFAHYGCVDEI